MKKKNLINIHNSPIIKYIFLHKILNSLVHKVKLFDENNNNLDTNYYYFSLKDLSEEITDFITYGYEFIPEDFFKNKNKDLIQKNDFIQIILQTKSNLENTFNTNNINIDINKLNSETDIYSETGIKNDSYKLLNKQNSSIVKKFYDMQFMKNKQGKSRFLYQKININKNNIKSRYLLNKSFNYDNNKYNKNNENKKTDYNINKNIINNNYNIKSQFFNILYDDINNLDEKIKKDKINYNNIKIKEKLWKKLLLKKDENDMIYYAPKKERKIKSGFRKDNRANKLNKKFSFNLPKYRRIKSAILLIYQSWISDDTEKVKIKNLEVSSINSYYKNRLKKKKYNPSITKPEINLFKQKSKIINKEKKNFNNSYQLKRKPLFNRLKKAKKKNIKQQSKKKKEFEEEKNEENSQIINDKNNKINLNSEKNKDLKNIFENNNQIASTSLKNLNSVIYSPTDISNINQSNKNDGQTETSILYEKYLSDRQKHINLQKDSKLLSMILDSENIKSKRKKPKTKFIIYNNLLQSKNPPSNQNNLSVKKEYNIDIKPKKEEKKLFEDIKAKSLKEIEKKKTELLYQFKYDIKYKIFTGEMNAGDMDSFEEFKKKINNLKNNQEDDVEKYVAKIQNYFQGFKEEMADIEKNKLNENRINQYLKKFKEEYSIKNLYKDIQEKKLIKVVNYSQINHINTLNDSKNNLI